MSREMNLIATLRIRRNVAICPMTPADAEHLVLRAIDGRLRPRDRRPRQISRRLAYIGNGIVFRVFVADDRAIAIFETNLSIAGVARQGDEVPATRDEPLHVVAHFLGPV